MGKPTPNVSFFTPTLTALAMPLSSLPSPFPKRHSKNINTKDMQVYNVHTTQCYCIASTQQCQCMSNTVCTVNVCHHVLPNTACLYNIPFKENQTIARKQSTWENHNSWQNIDILSSHEHHMSSTHNFRAYRCLV